MKNQLAFGHEKVGKLFRLIFFPTLVGMIFNSAFSLVDGIFVGKGIGPDALASVNIIAPYFSLTYGLGLMFGMGSSVIGGILLSDNKIPEARRIMTMAFLTAVLVILIILTPTILNPVYVIRLLGGSDLLIDGAMDYLVAMIPGFFFIIIQCLGLLLIRLDGSPKYAMYCQVIPIALNFILDYLFIFTFDYGLAGAAWATSIGCIIGGIMVLVYFFWFSNKLKFTGIKFLQHFRSFITDFIQIIKLGFATFLSEAAVGTMIFTGNYAFMKFAGENGVAAYAVVCYLFPMVFSVAMAVSQSAQPIISFNYGMNDSQRVKTALRYAVMTSVIIGIIVMSILWIFNNVIVRGFITPGEPSFYLAVNGLPYFATCAIFFALNITFIGFYQSIERAWRSIWYTLLRGIFLMIPAFIILPHLIGEIGLWLAIPIAEFITSVIIIILYMIKK